MVSFLSLLAGLVVAEVRALVIVSLVLLAPNVMVTLRQERGCTVCGFERMKTLCFFYTAYIGIR